MFNQKFFTMKTSFLEQQTKVGKTTKFIMGNDGAITKFYNYPLFPQWSMLVWIWRFMNLHPTPFWAFKNQELIFIFFYIEYAWLWFFFCTLSFMLQWAGPIWVGVQFPNRALLPKVGNRKSMIGKGIEKKIKGL